MVRIFFGLIIVFTTGVPALAQPAEVIIIRHAEKPPEGDELSPRGRERAAALVKYFEETPDVLEFKTPIAIYAQSVPKKKSSRRAIETVQPLAHDLKLKINESYSREQYRQMVAEVMGNARYQGHTVLISWEHKVIPEMAKTFGVDDAPTKWRGEDYDRVWIIAFHPDGKPTFKDLPQHLLPGDSDK